MNDGIVDEQIRQLHIRSRHYDVKCAVADVGRFRCVLNEVVVIECLSEVDVVGMSLPRPYEY